MSLILKNRPVIDAAEPVGIGGIMKLIYITAIALVGCGIAVLDSENIVIPLALVFAGILILAVCGVIYEVKRWNRRTCLIAFPSGYLDLELFKHKGEPIRRFKIFNLAGNPAGRRNNKSARKINV